jgi:hypothetical protein
MTVSAGTRLGAYEVVTALGEAKGREASWTVGRPAASEPWHETETNESDRVKRGMSPTPSFHPDGPAQLASWSRLTNGVVFAIVIVGIALRTLQYAVGASLWNDELALVKGILDFDVTRLVTEQLPFDQVAPKGFLVLQKLVVATFGSSEYALRAVPFAGSLVALVVFARLVLRTLPPVAAIVATLLLATAAPLVGFAAIVKQYSTDVCIAVVLMWWTLDLITTPVTERKAWTIAIAGAILLWFSQPAVIVAAGLSCLVWLWMTTDPPGARQRRVVIIVAAWALSALAVTVVAMATMSADTRTYMRAFWDNGLAPWSLARLVEEKWPWPRIRNLFGGGPGSMVGMAYPFSPFYPALTVIGVAILWVRQQRVAAIVLAPIVVTLAAAVARQYPFADRLVLFLAPSAVIAIAAAAAELYDLIVPWSKVGAAIAVTALALPAVTPIASVRPPYRFGEIEIVLKHLQAGRQPGDAVYVFHGAAPAVNWYGSEHGLSRRDYVIGGCHRGDSRHYLEEIDTFRGSPRLWIVFMHWVVQMRERDDIFAYLDTIGTRIDHVSIPSHFATARPSPAEVFLYDLSAPARLASADAQSFKLVGGGRQYVTNSCNHGPVSMVRSDFECANTPNSRCTRRPSDRR